MKNRKLILSSILFTISMVSLSSCNYRVLDVVRFNDYLVDHDDYLDHEYDNYKKSGSYQEITYLTDVGEKKIKDYSQLFRLRRKSMTSTGEQYLAVIPVEFSDYPADKTHIGYSKEDSIKVIDNAFFGVEEVNQYESVASYYNRSSYGKLKLKGMVTDWFKSPLSVSQLKAHHNKANVTKIYNAAMEWLKTNYKDEIPSYYVDGDSDYPIPIYLVYTYPNSNSLENNNAYNDVFWAFAVTSNALYAWSSFSMLNIRYGKPDSHTLIHETGHLFGLDDYYSMPHSPYGGPTGRIDIMDFSIGDHTSYSKMLLNWTRPYHVKGNSTITISPFTLSGDVILINDFWNNTPMDEYLLIEFYSPLGLNYFDSKIGNSEAILPSKPGIKVYHVCSKIGVYDTNKITPLDFLDDYLSKNEFVDSSLQLGIINSNTHSNAPLFAKEPLYHLLEVDGNNTYMERYSGLATNEKLWHEGDSFGVDTFKNYQFYNVKEQPNIGYTFVIDSLTDFEATITFKKI